MIVIARRLARFQRARRRTHVTCQRCSRTRRRSSFWLGLRPILRKHRVDDGIFKPLTEPLRFTKDTFFDKSESARNRSASHIPWRDSDVHSFKGWLSAPFGAIV
jgi:hypothetical protein